MIEVRETDNASGERLEEAVDADIEDFGLWFQQERGQSPLSNYEHAMVKTYLAYKLGLGREDKSCKR